MAGDLRLADERVSRVNKGGLSWKLLVGFSGAKARMSPKIGIPLTRSGRHQKIGLSITGGRCLLPTTFLLLVADSITRRKYR
jgi:hypothetical protein